MVIDRSVLPMAGEKQAPGEETWVGWGSQTTMKVPPPSHSREAGTRSEAAPAPSY